jgi:AcrR family transcriptional regulator
MCSAKTREPSIDHSDLTARARIRDSAIRLFASNGFAATSVRAIADGAGVSPALVIHHFGSKKSLRRDCDEHVLKTVVGEKARLLDADLLGSMHEWLTKPEQFKGAFDYVARTLSEPSDLGTTLFEGLVAKTRALLADGVERGTTRASKDPDMRAVIVALHGLAPLVLQHHLGRSLGHDGLTKGVIQRMTVPTLELYTHGLYTTSAYLDTATAALEGGLE